MIRKTLSRIAGAIRDLRRYERALAVCTPLRDGRETRRVARAVQYHPDVPGLLADGAVEFEPRHTYPARALEWARGR